MLEALQLQQEMELSSQELSVLDDVREVDPSICEVGGITFKLKKVSRILLVDATRKIKTPKPPIVMISDKGREEENPTDPDYQAALADSNYLRAMTVINIYVTLGTKPVKLPEGLEPPESNSWIEELVELDAGFENPKSERSRYLQWIKYVALDDTQINELVTAVMRFSGVTLETDVQKAQESFRNN